MAHRDDSHEASGGGIDTDGTTYFREPGERPSTSAVRAVSEATGTDPTSLRPLYEVIDPDAVDRLFEPTSGGRRGFRNGCVSFRFERCDVTVHADGRTVVSPADDDQP